MSNVFLRNRPLSSYEFYDNAINICNEVNRIVSSESLVSKKQRFLNGVPAMESARSMLYNINRFALFYPNNARSAYERKKYITLAIADCEQLCLDMQRIIDMNIVAGKPPRIKRFEDLAKMIDSEIKLLKGMLKKLKIIGVPSIADKILDVEDELEKLRMLQ